MTELAGLIGHDLGPLAPLVKLEGELLAAAVAIAKSWTPRWRWDPLEQDVPGWVRSAAVPVLAVAGLALLWLASRRAPELLLPLLVVVVLIFVFVVTAYTRTFSRRTLPVVIAKRGRPRTVRAVIGDERIPEAIQTMRTERVPLDEYFKGVQFKPERVWTSKSLASARARVTGLYIAMLVTGTLLLATAGLLLLPYVNGG